MITVSNSYELDQLAQLLLTRYINSKSINPIVPILDCQAVQTCMDDIIDSINMQITGINSQITSLQNSIGTEHDPVAIAKTITINPGAGLSLTAISNIQTLGSNPVWTLNHSDTSTVANLTTTGLEVVDSLIFDTYGHVTGATKRTLSLAGSVSSVGLQLPSIITVTNSPITSSGTIVGTLTNQAANRIFAGPSSGGNAQPTFRQLGVDDIPDLSSLYLTSAVVPLNGLLPATNSHVIDNGNFGQEWAWNALTTSVSGLTYGLKLSSNNNTSSTSGTAVLIDAEMTGNVSVSGFSKNFMAGRFVCSKNKSTSGGTLNVGVYSEARGVQTGPGGLTNFAYQGLVSGNGTCAQFQNLSNDALIGGGLVLSLFNSGGTNMLISNGGSQSNQTQSIGMNIQINGFYGGTGTARGIEFVNITGGTLQKSIAIQVDNGTGGLCAFQALNNAPYALVHIGASTNARASLIIEENGLPPTSFIGGEIWISSGHLWARVNGITYQLENQGSSTDIYSTDGSLSSTRVVNMAGNSVTWDNSGLFRIRDITGATDGVYDFNQGLDFLTYNTNFSVNIAQAIATGVHLAYNDLNTPSNSKTIDLTATGVGFGTNTPSTLVDINSNKFRVRTAKTPASATDTGNAGDICWDSGFVYVCVATNTWKRTAIATW